MSKELMVVKKDVLDVLETRINEMVTKDELVLPKNYVVGNAMKSAWLTLQNTVDKNKKKALEVCTKDSIANSILEMTVKGLDPMKKQCYFIVMGNQLTLFVSYLGKIALAKRLGAKEIIGMVVYEKDTVETEIKDNKYYVTSHKQNFFGDKGKAIGAYATAYFNDKSLNRTELMTFEDIQQAWKQAYGYKGESGTSVHNKFQSEMIKKTVIGRVAKTIIGTSSDEYLQESEVDKELANEMNVVEEIETNANVELIDIDDKKETIVVDGEVVEEETGVIVETRNTEEAPF